MLEFKTQSPMEAGSGGVGVLLTPTSIGLPSEADSPKQSTITTSVACSPEETNICEGYTKQK